MVKPHPRIMIEIFQNKIYQVWSDVPLKCIVRNLDLTKIHPYEVKVWPIDTTDREKEMIMLEEISDLTTTLTKPETKLKNNLK